MIKFFLNLLPAFMLLSSPVFAGVTTQSTECTPLPTGPLSEKELAELVPDDDSGKVRISWVTQMQEETYGFNILRADAPGGPYQAVNKSIISGEGTTNIPKSYCFQDVDLPRGRIYYYQVEEVTNSGEKTIIKGTAATRVQVKSVTEEREWLKKKAAGKS